jgi:hypothetical protein
MQIPSSCMVPGVLPTGVTAGLELYAAIPVDPPPPASPAAPSLPVIVVNILHPGSIHTMLGSIHASLGSSRISLV